MDYKAYVISNIEVLGYEYDFYKLNCAEANEKPISFNDFCRNAFLKAQEIKAKSIDTLVCEVPF